MEGEQNAKIRVEIAEIRNSPCQIAVLWPENGDLTRGIIKNGYFNPCFGEVRHRDGGARKKRKPGGEAGLEREEKKGVQLLRPCGRDYYINACFGASHVVYLKNSCETLRIWLR